MEKLMLPFQVSASVFIRPPAQRHNLLCAPSIFWTYMTKQQQDVVVGRCRLFCVSVVCCHRLLPSLTPLMFHQVFVTNERPDSLSCWNPHHTKIMKAKRGHVFCQVKISAWSTRPALTFIVPKSPFLPTTETPLEVLSFTNTKCSHRPETLESVSGATLQKGFNIKLAKFLSFSFGEGGVCYISISMAK